MRPKMCAYDFMEKKDLKRPCLGYINLFCTKCFSKKIESHKS